LAPRLGKGNFSASSIAEIKKGIKGFGRVPNELDLQSQEGEEEKLSIAVNTRRRHGKRGRKNDNCMRGKQLKRPDAERLRKSATNKNQWEKKGNRRGNPPGKKEEGKSSGGKAMGRKAAE